MNGTGKRKELRIAWLKKAVPAVFFVFVFILYFSQLGGPYYADEQESYVGAYSVIKGKDLYASYHCQHMPFSYYYAVPLALLGARTVFQFRLGTYLLLSLLWEGVFLRHRRRVHPAVLFAVPLLYLSLLKPMFMGTAMLADHWQGIGFILILLEMTQYVETKEIPLPGAVMIALGITLSLGFSFASSYSLFCFFLAAASVQAGALRGFCLDYRAGRMQAKDGIRRILREDLRLAGLSLLPFALLLGWYALSGNLGNFYISCFENVTGLYSKYSEDGVGGNPVSVIWTTVLNFGRYLGGLLSGLGASPWPGLLYLVSAVSLAGLTVNLVRKAPAAGILTLLAVIYGGLRGFDGFHSAAYQAMTAVSLAFCLNRILCADRERKTFPRILRWTACGAAVLLFADFALWAGYNLYYPQILERRTLRSEERILDLLTDPEEEVCICSLHVSSLDAMDLELVPMDNCFAAIYPFFWKPWGGKMMASLRKQMPRVVIYNPEERNNGPAVREYAPDLDAFIVSHYTRLPQAETVWVSNSFLPEARRRLEGAGYGNLLVSDPWDTGRYRPVEFFPGQSVTASFIAEESVLTAVRFCAACFFRRSDPTLTVRLRDAETGDTLAQCVMTGQDIADNLFSRCPLSAELSPGKTYELELSVERIGGKGDMEFYFTPEDRLVMAEEYLR